MSDVQETQEQEEPKKGFFARIGEKIMSKVRAINPNTIGSILLCIIAAVTLLVVLGSITSIIQTIAGGGEGVVGRVFSEFGTLLIMLVLLLALAAMIYHMMITLNQELRFKTEYTVEKFKELRAAAGKSGESTNEENQQCYDLMDQMVDCWTDIEKEDGQEWHYPKNMKEITKARKLLVQIIDIAPTEKKVVDSFVRYAEILKSKTDRQFDGSGMLLALASGVALIIIIMGIAGLAGGGGLGVFIVAVLAAVLFFLAPCGVYFLACRTPGFMLEVRKNKKPSRFKFVNVVVMILFGAGIAGLKADLGGSDKWYKV
ncbi:MAG: hypothetical protein LBU66_04335, partial [Treponema sp.]|nr:hypothetical protein [Treponema sp.]